MAVEAQVCPQCGSAIHFKKGQTKVVCEYCGTTVNQSAASDVSLKKEIEEEKIVMEIIQREARLYGDGQPATAKILSAQMTNIMRDTPEGKGVIMSFTLEVHPKNEAPFNASTTTSIGLVAVDKYQPGTVLDVSYDPKDTTQVSVEGRHGLTNSYYQQMRKADEQIREGDEMMRQAEAEFDKAEKEMEEADQEMAQADEKMQKLRRKK